MAAGRFRQERRGWSTGAILYGVGALVLGCAFVAGTAYVVPAFVAMLVR
jgi:hypothetical protein